MNGRSSILAAALLLALIAARASAAPPALSIEVAADHKEIRITLNPARRSGLALVELIDPATGRCVRTIYAGPTTAGQVLSLTKISGVAPGTYKLRYRQGVDVTFAAKVEPAAELKTTWKNPTDIFMTDRAIYVLETGYYGLEDPAHRPVEREWKSTKGPALVGRFNITQSGYLYVINPAGAQVATVFTDLIPEDQKLATELEAARVKYNEANGTYAYKFKPDGQPDLAFGDHGRLKLLIQGYYFRTLAIADDGEIFMHSGGHSVQVLSADGAKAVRVVGGWDGDPLGPKCTPACGSLALGPWNHIYLPSVYQNMKLYDRTKADFAGVLGRIDLPATVGMDRCITADRDGRVYEIGSDSKLHKFTDDGKALKTEYVTLNDDKLASPTGPHGSGGLVWLACHGPGFGPYWDSGGGGEVVLYWDDMQSGALRLVDRYGIPGKSADALEFINPAAVAMTPDHRELWISEDGMENKEGPPGNGRVRRFLVKESKSEEAELVVPAWP